MLRAMARRRPRPRPPPPSVPGPSVPPAAASSSSRWLMTDLRTTRSTEEPPSVDDPVSPPPAPAPSTAVAPRRVARVTERAALTTASESQAATSPSFTRVRNTPSTTAALAAQFGSVRRAWRPYLATLAQLPLPAALQHAALATASFFTPAQEVEFHLPRDFAAHYRLAEVLGEGAFGRVHRVDCVDPRVQLELAVKVVPKTKLTSLRDYQALQQEGRMMVLLGATLHVAHFFGAYEDDHNVYLVLEHCVGGDAFVRLQRQHEQNPVDQHVEAPAERVIAGYMADILQVVRQCHLLRILHGDLKLDNFLFADTQDDSPLKLTDFGGASFLEEGEVLHDLRGTPLYTAPEVLRSADSRGRGPGYSFPSDLWSCGVILYRLLAGRFPFEAGALLDERIQSEPLDLSSPPWPSVSREAVDLVVKLLDRDPVTRWTAEQALQHPWLRPATTAAVATTTTSTGIPTGSHAHAVDLLEQAPLPLSRPLLNGTLMQRLQLYRALTSFQQAVFIEIAARLPLAAKEDVVVLFSEMTRDGALRVGIPEFAAWLRDGGYRVTLGEVKSLLSRLDLDGDGQLSLDECCAALLDWSALQRAAPSHWDSLVGDVFAALDGDGDGLVTLEDLATLAPFRVSTEDGGEEEDQGTEGEEVGERRPRRQDPSFRSDMRRSFQHADLDRDGGIDRHDFQSMLHMQLRAYEHLAARLAPAMAPASTREAATTRVPAS